jgi:hypothetical protein
VIKSQGELVMAFWGIALQQFVDDGTIQQLGAFSLVNPATMIRTTQTSANVPTGSISFLICIAVVLGKTNLL